MKVLLMAGLGVMIAAVASAEVVNIAQFDPCGVFDSVDPFTDEHEASFILCKATPAGSVNVSCGDRGRLVMLIIEREPPATANVRLRIGTGEVHDTIWFTPSGMPAYYVETIDDEGAMYFVNELLDGISTGELILFQVGEEVYRVTFDEGHGNAEAVADFTARCDVLDEEAVTAATD